MGLASGPVRLEELARELGLDFQGAPEFEIEGAGSLDRAGPRDLAFVRSPAQVEAVAASRAGCLVRSPDGPADERPALLSSNPALDFARALESLWPAPSVEGGVHASAVVDPGAQVHPRAEIGALASVGAGAIVGPGSRVRAGVQIYEDVVVGADCEIHANVVLREGTRLGDRVILHPGVVIGGDGFGYVVDRRGDRRKMPQRGGVVIEDDVEIGAASTVDRGTLDPTRIRKGAKIDNLVQIGHNCDIGERAIIAAHTGLSGSTRVEEDAILMGQVGSAGHLRVGRGAFVGARAGLHKDVPAGSRVWGTPQLPERTWHRAMAALARLPEALRRLRAVERELGLRTGRKGREPDSRGER